MSVWLFLLAGLGVWLLVEGSLCALAPDLVRRLARRIEELPSRDLAIGGLVTSGIGLGLLLLAARMM